MNASLTEYRRATLLAHTSIADELRKIVRASVTSPDPTTYTATWKKVGRDDWAVAVCPRVFGMDAIEPGAVIQVQRVNGSRTETMVGREISLDPRQRRWDHSNTRHHLTLENEIQGMDDLDEWPPAVVEEIDALIASGVSRALRDWLGKEREERLAFDVAQAKARAERDAADALARAEQEAAALAEAEAERARLIEKRDASDPGSIEWAEAVCDLAYADARTHGSLSLWRYGQTIDDYRRAYEEHEALLKVCRDAECELAKAEQARKYTRHTRTTLAVR